MKLRDLYDSMETPVLTAQNSNDQQSALEFFLKETSNLNTYEKGLKFELFCKQLLEHIEYKIDRAGPSGDRGVDLKGPKTDSLGNITVVAQCKYQ